MHDGTGNPRSASEERYRALFDSNPDPILVYDPLDGSLLEVNAAAVHLYGWSRTELLGMTYLDLHAPEEVPGLLEGMQQMRSAPRLARHAVCSQRRRDERPLRTEVSDEPIELEGRRARIAVHRDVTRRERVEAQLRQSQKLEAVGAFAGGVAHDVNNVLGMISGFADAVREALPPGSGAAEDLANLLEAVARGGELTKKLGALSRKQTFRSERFDLSAVVLEFGAMLSRGVGEGVALRLTPAPEEVPISADRTQVEQILTNLVSNARQAMPEGGVIAIETGIVDADEAFVSAHPWARPGRFGELRVTDDGIGMDSATLARAFEPFFGTKPEGAGLGLAVVHGIVEQHAGAVTAESTPGRGTSVRVLWPLDETAQAVEPAPPRRLAPRGSERLLVVEDEPLLRQLTERSLRRLGYSVVTTRDGEEALAEFERDPEGFDLVVLDVVMPRLDGREVCDRMRQRRPGLKVLFITGHTLGTTGRGRLDDPNLGLLVKPFNSMELAERVRELIERR